MAVIALRKEIKSAVDQLPQDRLASLADYIAFLNRPTLRQQITKAERDLKAGKGVNWRKVRRDV
jgi:hypothetical protein